MGEGLKPEKIVSAAPDLRRTRPLQRQDVALPENTADLTTLVLDALRRAGHDDRGLFDFARFFLSQAEAEDLSGLSPASLAVILQLSWEFLAQKDAGAFKVRAYDQATEGTGSPDGFTVIEMINDDKPFLLDSVMGEIQARGLKVLRVFHPVFQVMRDETGKCLSVRMGRQEPAAGISAESLIQIHVARLPAAEAKKELCDVLSGILEDVHTVVADWQEMLERLNRSIDAYTNAPPPVAVAELAESIHFLKWLVNDNFTFLGMRAYAFIGGSEQGDLRPVPDSGLGLLRNPDMHVLRRGEDMVHMSPEIRAFFLSPAPLIVTKANVISRVHRRVHMDYVGVKIYADNGEITGELRIVGLFTSSAYTRSVTTIPFLRHKVSMILQKSGHSPQSHSGKALLNVLETFPRDELFQIDPRLLYKFVIAIHHLDLKPETRVFVRVDPFDRFVSLLVYVPRERYSTQVRMRIGETLAELYDARVSAYRPFFPEGPLVRIHFILGRQGTAPTPRPPIAEVESRIRALVRSWDDNLARLAEEELGAERAKAIARKYRGAFSAAYQESFDTRQALGHVRHIESLTDKAPLALDFFTEPELAPNRVRLALYHFNGPIPLSRRVPILENLGFSVIDEQSFRIRPRVGAERLNICFHHMLLESKDGEAVDLTQHGDRLKAAFLTVWQGETGNDAFNRLILAAGADWREAAVMRALGAYLRQIGAPFSTNYLCRTLLAHASLAQDLLALFRARFDPDMSLGEAARKAQEDDLVARIEAALEKIPNLDEDRILRHYLNLICAMSRTNFFQLAPERPKGLLAFKFASGKIQGLPEPKPFAEIFVFSPRVQGIHLRAGPIARGGLRWSERPQDFRMEVLNLVKAQQAKNAVIVPAGAKGGFVPMRLPPPEDREAVRQEGVACYRQFVDSLLSLTDNLEGGKVVPPPRTVRHDRDDPYLVVAADKGTASFSDIANEIAQRHHFWLDDAFASGGSSGYDHKKMGITARGAWEAVRRHFREMDINIQTTPFTVIGVGDMSGDVFGNGMLLSRHIRLLAAFDHRHIFIDPNPDPGPAFEERRRLFDMPRSSWRDYNPQRISKGGGVFSRTAKAIPLSEEMRAMLDVTAEKLTPDELISAILRAPADLLWFGGIGTYVRASGETNLEVGDRANDDLRVTAKELRVKVVGEGANLGMTQRARIEFAQHGGRVNTDAIDNSAGVNSSDLEVNIKIVLGQAMAAGKLDRDSRDGLLKIMTEEVATRCLRNNYLQTLAISLAERRGVRDLGFQQRLMRELEDRGHLDRELEFLPSDSELSDRRKQGRGLTRPEIAVLLAYAKIDLSEALLASDLPDDPYLLRELLAYFPKTLRDRFPQEISAHRLRREIIATRLANAMLNRGGATLMTRLKDETGKPAAQIVRAFVLVREVFALADLYRLVDELDDKVPGDLQLQLYQDVQDLLYHQIAWVLRHETFQGGLEESIEFYRSGTESFVASFKTALTPEQRQAFHERQKAWEAKGLGEKLSRRIAALPLMAEGPDVVDIARLTRRKIDEIAPVYFAVTAHFRLADLRDAAQTLDFVDYYDRLALSGTLDLIAETTRQLVMAIVKAEKTEAPAFAVWLSKNKEAASRTRRVMDELLDSGNPSLSRFTVALTHLQSLLAGT